MFNNGFVCVCFFVCFQVCKYHILSEGGVYVDVNVNVISGPVNVTSPQAVRI